MAGRKKQVTEEDRFKMELAQELELFRLERQYKLMERNRLSLSHGGSKLAKQMKVLNILTKEHKEILTDLNVATSSTNKKKYETVMKNLNFLLEEHNEFSLDIKKEKTELNEMNFHIKNLEKNVIEKKKNILTEFDEQQKVLLAQKNLEALENKLETATRRFCTIISENMKLREEIHHYLIERKRFNILWGRLIENLTKGKKFMLDLIEQATIAYDQRDECCLKLQALKTRAKQDFVMHCQKMLKLQRNIDADRELELFLQTKGQRRVMVDLNEKREAEHALLRENLENQLLSYQKMLTDIGDFTGETEIIRIADKFIKTEVQNFGDFLYINDLNRQMETLSGDLAKLHVEIDGQTSLRSQRGEGQEKKIVKLEQDLEDITLQVTEAETELEQIEGKLNNMMQGIDQIFNICKCSNAPLLQLLGDNTTINYFNVLLYLQLLEQQVNFLMMFAYYKQKTGDKKRAKENIIRDEIAKTDECHPTEMVPTTPCPLCIEQDQVVDLVEFVQFVLDRKEIEERLYKMLNGPEARDVDHNVSACHLPKSRQIIQRRYQ